MFLGGLALAVGILVDDATVYIYIYLRKLITYNKPSLACAMCNLVILAVLCVTQLIGHFACLPRPNLGMQPSECRERSERNTFHLIHPHLCPPFSSTRASYLQF